MMVLGKQVLGLVDDMLDILLNHGFPIDEMLNHEQQLHFDVGL